MRSINKLKAYCLFSAALIIAAVFCACTASGTVSPAPSPAATAAHSALPSPSAAAVPSPSPSAGQSETPEPTAEATPFELNPLWTFCNDYSAATDSALITIADMLGSIESNEALEMSIMCSAHRRVLSTLAQSIGRLTYTQSGVYSATISGSESGSGTMSAADGGYNFEFTYDNGDILGGYFNTDAEYVQFAVYSADSSAEKLSGRIMHDDSGWTSYASEYIYDTALHVAPGGGTYFALGERQAILSGDTLRIGDYSPPPEPTATPDAVSFATP